MATEEIMCCEDFERAFHVLLAEKSCANCKHGSCDYEGFATCSHPKRNDCGYGYEEGEEKYYPYNTLQCNTCDLYEKKGNVK